LIGVDEKAGKVVGASFSEFANWYATVGKEFDGIAPRCCPLHIPHKDVTVVALMVETDRVPYVVRNAVHGLQGRAPCPEVPWRHGTRTDSAKRAELVKLLMPVTKLPEVEVLAAGLWVQEVKPSPLESAHLYWRLAVHLFVAPRVDPVVIPTHRCESSLQPSEAGGYSLTLAVFNFSSDTPSNIPTKTAVTINTPGLVSINAHYGQKGYTLPLKSETVRVVGKARPTGADAWFDWSCELPTFERKESELRDYVGIWGVGPFRSF
jgi:hypothetical protein